ncbi:expressed unknown protein [Ectocarpus siliculosus]|uniref:Uncharacterized protein n=1 Tax=Ectocarpus siliculosus TaxID=2880 RepID=D7G4N9_ECTSI|nr:expressed unknown protein [Ectocarpus siliculosus]|eukprot:CBJ33726.1 expressed unknown protein [Ectocarpus siliculosus]
MTVEVCLGHCSTYEYYGTQYSAEYSSEYSQERQEPNSPDAVVA